MQGHARARATTRGLVSGCAVLAMGILAVAATATLYLCELRLDKDQVEVEPALADLGHLPQE